MVREASVDMVVLRRGLLVALLVLLFLVTFMGLTEPRVLLVFEPLDNLLLACDARACHETFSMRSRGHGYPRANMLCARLTDMMMMMVIKTSWTKGW
jgi:hypothetical protein